MENHKHEFSLKPTAAIQEQSLCDETFPDSPVNIRYYLRLDNGSYKATLAFTFPPTLHSENHDDVCRHTVKFPCKLGDIIRGEIHYVHNSLYNSVVICLRGSDLREFTLTYQATEHSHSVRGDWLVV